jgi:hypothetical protein
MDEDVIAKMLSDGARSHDLRLQKNSVAAAHSNSSPRERKNPNTVHASVADSSQSPRSSERRSRALASAIALKTPTAAAVTSLAETHLRMDKQGPKSVAHQPKHQPPLHHVQTFSAANTNSHITPVSLHHHGECCVPSQTADAGRSSAGISAGSALAVLDGLAEIREMKADSLERSLERESVSLKLPVSLLMQLRAPEFLLLCAGAHQPSCGHRSKTRIYSCAAHVNTTLCCF